jgi:acyl-CoA thioesterase-2
MQVCPGKSSDSFTGKSISYGVLGIYGGHFLGQALSAGLATVEEHKLAQSYHAYFLKAGDPSVDIEYRVERIREGRNSEVRGITAVQGGVSVFHMIAAFKIPEPGDEHQKASPVVPSVDEVIAARQASGIESFRFPMVQGGRVEMEFISDSFIPEKFAAGREPILRTWMRVPACEAINSRSRQSVLAFLSDGTLMFNSVLPYGIPFQTHRLTSLDQSVWFHRDVDPGDWMLYDQRSTAAADGRGLNEGEVYTSDGVLIMSTAQESMLRAMPAAG